MSNTEEWSSEIKFWKQVSGKKVVMCNISKGTYSRMVKTENLLQKVYIK